MLKAHHEAAFASCECSHGILQDCCSIASACHLPTIVLRFCSWNHEVLWAVTTIHTVR